MSTCSSSAVDTAGHCSLKILLPYWLSPFTLRIVFVPSFYSFHMNQNRTTNHYLAKQLQQASSTGAIAEEL